MIGHYDAIRHWIVPDENSPLRDYRPNPTRQPTTDSTVGSRHYRTHRIEGKVFCAFAVDTFLRRVVSWSIDSSLISTLSTTISNYVPLDGTRIHFRSLVHGGFSWSKQYVVVEPIVGVRPRLRREFAMESFPWSGVESACGCREILWASSREISPLRKVLAQ